MIYNCKILKYPNGSIQIRYYEKPIVKGFKKTIIDDELIDEDINNDNSRSIISSVNRTKNMINQYARSNNWDWFITFTISDKNIRYEYNKSVSKLTKWLNNIRNRYCPDMKYIFVPEKHKDGAYHFHGLMTDIDNLKFENAINNKEYLSNGQTNNYYGDYLRTSYPDGDFIYNIKQYKNGYSTATKVKDTKKASSYILKYITKELCDDTINKHRYFKSNNLDLPETMEINIYYDDLIKELRNEKREIKYYKDVTINSPNYENKLKIIEL